MGGRGSSSGRSGGAVAPATPFPATDSAPFHQLGNEDGYFALQTFDAQTQAAIAQYLDPRATRGSLYAPSQNLNYAMRQGLPLTAAQQTMRDDLMRGMHNLGQNLEMTRYCRVDYMADLGCANFDRMSITTLQRRLVGKTYTDRSFLSASCNNFSKAPGRNAFTDKAVKLNIKAPAGVKALMPGTGPGGNFGEFVFAPNQNYRITGVRWTGQRGRSGSRTYKQIELDVEIF